jgi:hypothetical protein
MGIDAVGAAAIGDDLGTLGKRRDDPFQIGKHGIDGTGDVTGGIFVRRSQVEHGHGAFGKARGEVLAADGLGRVLPAGEPAEDVFDLRQVPFGDETKEVHEREHPRVGEPVDHRFASASVGDEARPAEMLEMLGAVGDRQACLRRHALDGAFALRELLEDHEPRGSGEGAGHKRIFLEQGGLGAG